MPAHPPERPVSQTHREDLATIVRLDSLGFYEAWVGEHFTAAWEPCPAPDLLVAQALMATRQIRLGPLGHLLPYHHPITLAHRTAYLDQIAEGRYQLGVGISALPSDRELFELQSGGANRRMTFEALEMMSALWANNVTPTHGEFWDVGTIQANSNGLGLHLTPYRGQRPAIAIAGMTAGSENHRLAGEKGYLPVSLGVDADGSVTAQHWKAVEEGAARVGRRPSRADWRVVRDVVVAETDKDAIALARESVMGRCWIEFLIPLYRSLGQGPALLAGSGLPQNASDAEVFDHVATRLWICGSPSTVKLRIQETVQVLGEFGVLLVPCYDESGAYSAWSNSHSLLAEVIQTGFHGTHQRGCDEPVALSVV